MYSTMNQNTKTEQISSEIKNQLKNLAVLKYGIILPILEKNDFDDECFTEEKIENNGVIVYHFYMFWFNDLNHSTHITKIKI